MANSEEEHKEDTEKQDAGAKGPSSDLTQKMRIAADMSKGTPVGYAKPTINRNEDEAATKMSDMAEACEGTPVAFVMPTINPNENEAEAERPADAINDRIDPTDAAAKDDTKASAEKLTKLQDADENKPTDPVKAEKTQIQYTEQQSKNKIQDDDNKLSETKTKSSAQQSKASYENEMSRQQMEDKLAAQELMFENRQGVISLDDERAEDIAFPTEPLQNRVVSTPGAFAQAGIAGAGNAEVGAAIDQGSTPMPIAVQDESISNSEVPSPFNDEEEGEDRFSLRAFSTNSAGAPLIKATLVEDEPAVTVDNNNDFTTVVLVDAKPLGDSYRIRRIRFNRIWLIVVAVVCCAVVAVALVLALLLGGGGGGNSGSGSSNSDNSTIDTQENKDNQPPTFAPMASANPSLQPTESPSLPLFLGNSFDCSSLQACLARPFVLGIQFHGGNCLNSTFSQATSSVNCTDFPQNGKISIDSGELYYLRVNEDIGDGEGKDILFEGVVRQGCAYNVHTTEYLPSNLQIRVWPAVGNHNDSTILQDVRFHSSCSQELHAGDIFGSHQLVMFGNDDQEIRCSAGSADVCVSAHVHKAGCDYEYCGPDVVCNGDPLLPGTHVLLTTDLTCTSGIELRGRLVLDCQGNAIVSDAEPEDSPWSYGVFLVGSEVRNCEIQGFFDICVEAYGGIIESTLVQGCVAGVTVRSDGGTGSILLGTLNNVTAIGNTNHGVFVDAQVAKIKFGPSGVVACRNREDIGLDPGTLTAVETSSAHDSVVCSTSHPTFCQDDIDYFRETCEDYGFGNPSATPSSNPSFSPSSPPSLNPSTSPTASSEPSISLVPTAPPTMTSRPTTSTRPSMSPSLPLKTVVVDVQLDQYPWEISWSITRANFSEPDYSADYSIEFFSESVAVYLRPGYDYVFLIEDEYGDGLSGDDSAYYMIYSLDDEGLVDRVIALGGGDFGFNESVAFSILVDGSVAMDYDGDGYTDDIDCDDSASSVHPGAEEDCDGVDNNCNGDIDEGCGFTYYASYTEPAWHPSGSVWSDGLHFCETQGQTLCSYELLCPNGNASGVVPMNSFIQYQNTWVPISSSQGTSCPSNSYLQIGCWDAFANCDTCFRHEEIGVGALGCPEWGLVSSNTSDSVLSAMVCCPAPSPN